MLPQRLLEKIGPPTEEGCWPWTGYIMPQGYGQTGTNTKVHRLVHELEIGPIPEGWHVHHQCENRWCVNPDHLEALSPEDHLRETLRLNGSTYLWQNRQRLSSHCRKGHELSGDNLYYWHGKRYCKACIEIRNKKRNKTDKTWSAKRRAAQNRQVNRPSYESG